MSGMQPNALMLGNPAVRDALTKIRRVHAHFRAAEDALLEGKRDFSCYTAHEGFEAAILACEALGLIGDKAKGLRQIGIDTADASLRPAGRMLDVLTAQGEMPES